MRLDVLDGQGDHQTLIVAGVEASIDRSGEIVEAGTSQELLAANEDRSGWFFQNISTYTMQLNELGEDAETNTSFRVPPGGTFPPPGFPLTITAVNISTEADLDGAPSSAGSRFIAREW